MKIRISNMLRLEDAELDLVPGRITVVTGRNEAGKTSIATIAGSLLAHEANPAGVSKAHGAVYLRRGADAGEAQLVVDDQIVVRWLGPTGELAQLVARRASTPAAVGLVDFCGPMSQPERVKLWEGYFLPKTAQLEAAVREALKPYAKPSIIDNIIAHLRLEGNFKAMEDAYRTRSRDAKVEWTRVTGETWGSRKGADWLPAGWVAELDGVTVEDAQRRLDDAQAGLQSAQIAHAVDASIIARAEEAAVKIPDAQRRVDGAQNAMNAARRAIEQMRVDAKPAADRRREAEQARGLAQDRLDAAKADLARHMRSQPTPFANIDEHPLVKLAIESREEVKAREPRREDFVRGLSRIEQELFDLEASPPNKERVPEPIFCPHCNGELESTDYGRAVRAYDVEAARQEAEQRHGTAIGEWDAKRQRLDVRLNDAKAECEAQYDAAMRKWDEDLVRAEEKVAELRQQADESQKRQMHEFVEGKKVREESVAVRESEAVTAADAVLSAANATVKDAEAMEPLQAEARRCAKVLQDAKVELETLQRLAAEADGKVARTEEMVDAQDEAERAVASAREHQDLVKKRFEAKQHHENVVAYTTIATLLGPRGIRAQAVEERMSAFDGVLERIHQVTTWPRVALDKQYNISIGDDKILKLAAESARLRAQWCLQIAISRVRREPVVILDAADHLDAENLAAMQDLLHVLRDRPQAPAFLVCGTNLDTASLNAGGLNYRLDGGRLQPA